MLMICRRKLNKIIELNIKIVKIIMSGVSAIYFLDTKGKVIIFRNYRGEVTQNVSDK
jgi:hypothetical protein